jgi:hypothetical protein
MQSSELRVRFGDIERSPRRGALQVFKYASQNPMSPDVKSENPTSKRDGQDVGLHLDEGLFSPRRLRSRFFAVFVSSTLRFVWWVTDCCGGCSDGVGFFLPVQGTSIYIWSSELLCLEAFGLFLSIDICIHLHTSTFHTYFFVHRAENGFEADFTCEQPRSNSHNHMMACPNQSESL